jgi:molybdate transport system ATP-binding protein
MQLTLDFEKKLEDFHLRVHYEGEASRIGILGASGCGKSMTLRSIAGIETPDRGLIRLDSRELFDSSQKINLRPQERRVGYLFQNYALFPTMTVEQNIMAGVRGSKEEQRKRAQEMVRAFQLEGLEKRRPAELSGGQQQRVALARIMAYRPMALLLDEPFSAMDYFLKEKLRLEMKQVLRKYEGLSILVTHDRDEAYQLCDHLLLMHEGSIIAGGPTKEIFDHPGTVEAARLTGCKNISRIRQVGPHRICALDWDNLELTTQEEVTDEITHAGIRAHDFFPCASETAENRIPAENPALTELPFEWYIVLQNKIWWKVPKDIRSHDCSDCLPEALCVDPAAIMLLRRE